MADLKSSIIRGDLSVTGNAKILDTLNMGVSALADIARANIAEATIAVDNVENAYIKNLEVSDSANFYCNPSVGTTSSNKTLRVYGDFKVYGSDTTIKAQLSSAGNLWLTGDIYTNISGSNNDFCLYYVEEDNTNVPTLTLKHNTAGTGKWGVGVILGGKGATVIAAGEEGREPAEDWNDEQVYICSDGQTTINTNTNSGWSNRKTWTFQTSGILVCPNQVEAPSFYASSDARLKENIVSYKPEKSILDLPIYRYDFIEGSKNNIGCLAQDLQKICPEIVHENEEGYLSISESKIVYLLLDEVKKLKAEVEELKNK